jgi:Leucine-rich repeat (LRR) protein
MITVSHPSTLSVPPPAWFRKHKQRHQPPSMNALVVEEKIQEWKRKGDPTEPLDLSHLNLTQFPRHLPAELTHLILSGNYITHIPVLPKGLKVFVAEYGDIETIEGPLPSTLHTLHLTRNRIHTLPLRFPPALTSLHISCNELVELPLFWIPSPQSPEKGHLTHMIASNNKLHTFPQLPPSTLSVDLHNNHITSPLPPLPVSLINLNLASNRLTAFPPRLPPNLETLCVGRNQITHLPEHYPRMFPTTLHNLYIHNNPLLDKQGGDWEMDFGGEYFVTTESDFDYYSRIVNLQHARRAKQGPQEAKARTAKFKEELMMHVWRPERVAALLEAGYDPEDL